MKNWFVAQTHAQSEIKAAQQLRNQGFTVYLPQYLKPRRHARRQDMVSAPLFPRYLFVAFDPERDRWRAVRSTIGISHMIGNSDRPLPVPDQVINDIRSREDANGKVVLNKIHGLKVGEKVRVLAGAFADRYGIFQSITDDDRVRVLLTLLGQTFAAELPIETVSASA